jgi:hypothetical protein
MIPGRLGRLLGIAVALCHFSIAATAAWPAQPSQHSAPSPAAVRSPGLAGHWRGQWLRDGAALDVWLDFTRADSGYSGSFGSDGLRVLDIPFREVRVDSGAVHWTIVGDATTSRFDGKLAGDRLGGTFRDGDAAGTFEVRRTGEPTTPPYSIEPVRFNHGDVTLAGSLLMPASAGPHPAIVFVHGSGAEGRYASRYLADRFARAGFAALIYDKRGVGESGGDWRHSTFEDLAGDALAAIRLLAADRRVRPDAIGLHGHSQGGTIAPLIASQYPRLAFVIASAAGGVPLAEAERYSYRNFLGVSRLHGEDSLRATAYIALVVEVAYSGQPWERADSAAKANRGEKWFADIPGRDNSFWWLASRTAGYDPARYWRRVQAPVLLVFGERDERVPVERSLLSIRAALREAGNSDVTWKVFPGSDHTFRITGSDDGRFHWPRTPGGYPDTLIAWAASKTRPR